MKKYFVFSVILLALVFDLSASEVWAAATAEYQILATTMGGVQGMQVPMMLLLDARGAPAPSGEQRASHAIPPGMKMGKELPLLRPELQTGTAEKGVPGDLENWTLKIYWGDSKEVGKGQPIVISPQDMKSGKGLAALAGSEGAWKGSPPAGWGWGQWPNKQSGIPVPAGASLNGGHLVTGNYLPDIKFDITRHDFLPPLNTKIGGDPSTSMGLSWKPVQGAVGYFAYAMAADQAKRESIIWTSSSKASMGVMTHEHSAQVKKLVGEGVVMSSNKTACNIPSGIFAGLDGVVVMMYAWGEDYWMSYPPKPNNPPKDWKPDWTVNALFLSQWMGIPGMPDMEELTRMNSPAYDQDDAGETPARDEPGEGRGGIGIPFPITGF
ncbi:MAG: hypothetical protein LBS45_03770 [Synergistaceae bacterium]|jgi:hypothetical protein|nr:hypothetical protein [Synergistaceae bacterium]